MAVSMHMKFSGYIELQHAIRVHVAAWPEAEASAVLPVARKQLLMRERASRKQSQHSRKHRRLPPDSRLLRPQSPHLNPPRFVCRASETDDIRQVLPAC